jgi:putative transposase
MHKGEPIRQLLRRFPRLRLEWLPPYAPELNPVEQLWNHLKYAKLANFAPDDISLLDQTARKQLHRIKRSPNRLQSFLDAADLTFNQFSEGQ